MPARDIYLVRHAQSEWNAIGRWQGQADPPLSAHGHVQARALAEHFPDVIPTLLVSSDLQRALDTAAPLGERWMQVPEVDPALRELDVGSWTGKTREEIAAEDPEALNLFFQGLKGWQGGETYEQHERRAESFATRMRAMDDDDTVVAVTHGGTLRAIVLALLEIDHALRWRFTGIRHTSITHLTHGPHGYRLAAYNSVLEIEDV